MTCRACRRDDAVAGGRSSPTDIPGPDRPQMVLTTAAVTGEIDVETFDGERHLEEAST